MKISPSYSARPRVLSTAAPKTHVSAYIDGKSETIESMKLDAVKRLDSVRLDSAGQVEVTLDGQRHDLKRDAVIFAAVGVLPTVLAGIAGAALAGPAGGIAGAVAGLVTLGMPATHFLSRSLKAPRWKAGDRLELGGPSRPSPVAQAGAERLRSLVDEGDTHEGERHILFLSGHGNRDEIAHMKMTDIARAMKGASVDITLLDACLVGQLETLSKMAPWAGFVLASTHKVKARGMELPEILSPAILQQNDTRQVAHDMAAAARSTTPSFVAVDSHALKEELLPSLDLLGRKLRQSDRTLIREALRQSLSPDGLFTRRVDLGSFLQKLEHRGLCPEEVAKARKAFSRTLLFQKNDYSISFNLVAGRKDPSLPEGWRGFLREIDCGFKPIL